jgi:hypothetical protein
MECICIPAPWLLSLIASLLLQLSVCSAHVVAFKALYAGDMAATNERIAATGTTLPGAVATGSGRYTQWQDDSPFGIGIQTPRTAGAAASSKDACFAECNWWECADKAVHCFLLLAYYSAVTASCL